MVSRIRYDPFTSVGHVSVPLIGTPNPNRVMVISTTMIDGACEIFDIKTQSWSSAPSIPYDRQFAFGAAYNGRVYVFGGKRKVGLKRGDMYEEDSKTCSGWSSIADMSIDRSSAAAVVVDATILVMGGSSQSVGLTDSIEEYTPLTNTWRTLSWRLPRSTHSFAAVYHRETKTLMIAGGSISSMNWGEKPDPHGCVMVYTPPAFESNEWQYHHNPFPHLVDCYCT
jgi:hypothetical protein